MSGLPLDTTEEELAELFKRAGVLKVSVEDGKVRGEFRVAGANHTLLCDYKRGE